MSIPAILTMAEVSSRPWDQVVIGAGPAGAMAARELARRGSRVLLVDRAEFPRWKVCGCCLNRAGLDLLDRVGITITTDGIPLTELLLAARGSQAIVPRLGGLAISREKLDVALIQSAISEGVAFLPGCQARHLPPAGVDYRRVSLTRGEVEVEVTTGIVIAADGLNGQCAGGGENTVQVAVNSRIGAGAIADADASDLPPGRIAMAVGQGGYVGMVRLQDGRLDLAAAFVPEFVRHYGSLGLAAEAILQESGLPPVAGIRDLAWKGTPTLTRSRRAVAGERWFAVGDAAGYVEPFTGEGMAWALATGEAIAAIAAETWSPAQAERWARVHRQLLGQRRSLCHLVARLLRSPRLTGVTVQMLGLLPILARPVVGALNRPFLVTGSRV